jgi:methionyl-tRNA formyltransferase
MKIAFVGASKFGLKCLNEVFHMDECEIVGSVTVPKKFSISYQPEGVVNVLYADVESYCKEKKIPCLVMTKGMKDPILLDEVKSWQADIFLVVGWYHLIPKSWLDLAPAYGLHASLLPDYSGGAPLVWAIINGEKKTGITLFKFDKGVDDGPIVDQAETKIDDNDDIASLYSRIEELGLNLIVKNIPLIAKGEANLKKQEESNRRIFPQRRPEDGLIDWKKSAKELYNFIRAQTKPYPGAFTYFNGKVLKIWSTSISFPVNICLKSISTGQIIPSTDKILIKTGDGILELLEVSYEGNNIHRKAIRKLLFEGGHLGY